jgi:hypothetical protein
VVLFHNVIEKLALPHPRASPPLAVLFQRHRSLMAGSGVKPSVAHRAAMMGAPVGSWFSPRSA